MRKAWSAAGATIDVPGRTSAQRRHRRLADRPIGQDVLVSSPEDPPEPTTPVLSDTSHDAAESVTWAVRVAAAWSWRLIVVAAAAYLIFRALSAVSLVAFSLILSLFLTAILHPLERRLRAWLPGPKSVPTALTLLTGIRPRQPGQQHHRLHQAKPGTDRQRRDPDDTDTGRARWRRAADPALDLLHAARR